MSSFTSIVKTEVSKLDTNEIENIAELSAIIRNISNNDLKQIKITTENASVARRIFNLIKDTYAIISKITVRNGYNFNKNYLYIIEVNNKIEDILSDLSIYDKSFLDIPKSYITDDFEQKRAYLRGLFLSIGSVNDPKTSRYHLEFLVNNKNYASFIKEMLNEFYLNSKYIKRDNKYMVYIKEAEKIGDFLRLINASNAVLYFEDIRIYRDHKNMTNRLNNCEQANIDKVIITANEQVKSINKIIESGGLELLGEKEQIVAKYRLKYPETSLLELSEIITVETGKPITKSGISHRMKKIKDLSIKIGKNY